MMDQRMAFVQSVPVGTDSSVASRPVALSLCDASVTAVPRHLPLPSLAFAGSGLSGARSGQDPAGRGPRGRAGQELPRVCPPHPTTYPGSHPVCRRPTHRGAGVVHGVQVERATVRTTWTPWAASARLCLGRWQTGWELPAHATTRPALANGARPSRSLSAPAGGTALSVAALCSDRLIPPGLSTCGRASAQRARAGRRQERGAQRSREARPAERSAAGA